MKTLLTLALTLVATIVWSQTPPLPPGTGAGYKVEWDHSDPATYYEIEWLVNGSTNSIGRTQTNEQVWSVPEKVVGTNSFRVRTALQNQTFLSVSDWGGPATTVIYGEPMLAVVSDSGPVGFKVVWTDLDAPSYQLHWTAEGVDTTLVLNGAEWVPPNRIAGTNTFQVTAVSAEGIPGFPSIEASAVLPTSPTMLRIEAVIEGSASVNGPWSPVHSVTNMVAIDQSMEVFRVRMFADRP